VSTRTMNRSCDQATPTSRRRFLRLVAGAVALPAASRTAEAQTYPLQPVRIIVGFPPGGVADIYARLIGQWLSRRLGQTFIVENRPGAGGKLATELVARATPDGYTLLLTTSGDASNVTLFDNLRFNFIRDITPVAGISRAVGVLLVHPSLPSKSVPELITYARSNPGKVAVGSAGAGSLPHLYWELFRSSAEVEMLHVPYRGGALALTDLLANHIQVYFGTPAVLLEHIKLGRLRPLAVTSATRATVLPDIPALVEILPGYEANSYFGIAAPRGTPVEIIDRLNQESNLGLADSGVARQIEAFGDTVLALSSSEFGKLILDETEKWAKVIRAANIGVQ
jgi:tripartite-type tricarboxylate transporter receptor subunit TctC